MLFFFLMPNQLEKKTKPSHFSEALLSLSRVSSHFFLHLYFWLTVSALFVKTEWMTMSQII